MSKIHDAIISGMSGGLPDYQCHRGQGTQETCAQCQRVETIKNAIAIAERMAEALEAVLLPFHTLDGEDARAWAADPDGSAHYAAQRPTNGEVTDARTALAEWKAAQ